jgi:hypothetical protein
MMIQNDKIKSFQVFFQHFKPLKLLPPVDSVEREKKRSRDHEFTRIAEDQLRTSEMRNYFRYFNRSKTLINCARAEIEGRWRDWSRGLLALPFPKRYQNAYFIYSFILDVLLWVLIIGWNTMTVDRNLFIIKHLYLSLALLWSFSRSLSEFRELSYYT